MVVVWGELVRWGIDRLHLDNRFFAVDCDFGFSTVTAVDVAVEHDTMSPYRFAYQATLFKASDGIVFLHTLDESRPEERAIIDQVAAGAIFLSPGVQQLGLNNARTLGLPGKHYDSPHPVTKFVIAEASYCRRAGQPYLPPVEILVR